MEFDRRGLHRFETSRKHLTQAVVDGKGTPVLNDDVAKRGKRVSFGEPEHCECHLTDKPFRHSTGEIGKVMLRHLDIEGLVGDGGTKERMEAAVEIGDGLDTLAGTGRRQRQAQAKGRDDALASAKFHLFATGVEQRFGKHPLELVSDHAQLSVIHRGLLSLYLKQHAQEEFLMDRNKNQQRNQILKSTYLCAAHRLRSSPDLKTQELALESSAAQCRPLPPLGPERSYQHAERYPTPQALLQIQPDQYRYMHQKFR